MPKYSYKCCVCDRMAIEYRQAADRDYMKLCGEPIVGSQCAGNLVRQNPTVMNPILLEIADSYRKVKHRDKQDEKIRSRAKKHFKENEMNEMIEKVGIEKAKQFGWVSKDGKKTK